MGAMPVEIGRPSVRSTNGIVATSQRHAAKVGAAVLSSGGNAADATLATAAALAVTEPNSCGLGGDCFALYYDAAARSVIALNGSGRAPKALSLKRIAAEHGRTLDPFSAHTVTVPGTAAAWLDLHERFATQSLEHIFAGAIELADSGFEVGEITSHFWKLGAAMQLTRWPDNPADLLVDGRGPHSGERFKNPNMATVLAELAFGGREAFYGGRIGEAICAAVRQHGGVLSLDDLRSHCSEWAEPISCVHRDIEVFECPPNGQGLTALIALNILTELERDRPELEAFDDPRRLHREIESLRLAFADARSFIADPEGQQLPTLSLLSETYARERAAIVDPMSARVSIESGSPVGFSDTAYLAVVDAAGNACSLIFSNYMGFGTGIVPRGCGFTLQNRGHNFSLEPRHANAFAGGKRPYHTIIPALGLDPSTRELRVCFGVMGGFMQPQGHLQTLRGLAVDRLDPQQILDRPRFLIDPIESGSRVALEESYSADIAPELEKMGHKTRLVTSWQRAAFGRGQMITADGQNLTGGSDPRADGCAIGI